MGLDLVYRPVRLDSPSMYRLRYEGDSDLWEAASVRPPITEQTWGEPLPPFSKALLEDFPAGIPRDRLFDRDYERAEYLLDPVIRRKVHNYETRERSLPYRIVHGDEVFAEYVRATQGMPVRCSTSAFLQSAFQYIDTLNISAVRREFSLTEMVDMAVYKVSKHNIDDDDVDDTEFVKILARLRRLADYYRCLVAKGLDLLIIQD